MSESETPHVVKLSHRQRRDQNFAASGSHPLKVYRVKRIAELFDVHESTIWLWRKNGILPEPKFKAGKIEGWTHDQLLGLFKQEAANKT